MRILVSSSTFPVHLGDGTPRFVYDLAESLAEHAEVTVLAPDAPGALQNERLGSVDVRRFSYWPCRDRQQLAASAGRGMRDNFRQSWLARVQLPCFLYRQARVLRSLVRRERIDVVNAHWLIPQGLTTAWALRGLPDVRLVLHIHAGDVYLLRNLPLGRAVARYVVRRADAIFADGSHVRDTLNELLGYDCGAILQPMGVHSAAFGRTRREDAADNDLAATFPDGFALFVGRLVEKKGLVYLIQAMQHVVREFPGFGLFVIGTGPEELHLRGEVARLGLETSVRFVGHQPHAVVVRYLHQCQLAVVPSIMDSRGETEGMPTVVVEAMAAGARVVASSVAGIPDVIRHSHNGWLCRQKDPVDLAEKMIDALRSPEAPAVVRAALETANAYDWRQVAQNYAGCLSLPPQSLGQQLTV